MNCHDDCKVADFGVARVVDGLSTMTAETGTYRWMAVRPALRPLRRQPPLTILSSPRLLDTNVTTPSATCFRTASCCGR